MRVRCITNNPAEFPSWSHDYDYYAWLLRSWYPSTIFNDLEVGKSYTVYGISNWAMRPYYFIKYSHKPWQWAKSKRIHTESFDFFPALCFEVFDARLSRFWHFHSYTLARREEVVVRSWLGAKEWFEWPTFLTALSEDDEPASSRWREIAATMDTEFE